MENIKEQQRTKIISNEQYWDMKKEDREKFDGFYVDEVSVRYVQKVHNDFQELVLETEDSGGGRFFNIKTDKFSFNDKNELEDIIRDFLMRAKMGEK